MLRNWFSRFGFGRLSRKQFAIAFGGLTILSIFVPVVGAIISFFAGMMAASKRLHDMGYSGKFSLLSYVPFANIVLLFMLFFKEGEPWANSYGPPVEKGALGEKSDSQNGSYGDKLSKNMKRKTSVFGPLSDFLFNKKDRSSINDFYKKSGSKDSTHPVDFIFSLLMLGTFVIKHDKKVDEKELEFVFAFLKKHFDQEKAQASMKLLEDMLKTDWDLNFITRQVKQEFNYTTKLYLMQYLFGIAYSDSKFNEGTLLKRIGFKIGVDDDDYLNILRFWKKNDVESASEQVFHAEVDTQEWGSEELNERMEMAMAKLDPERVIEFGENVSQKAQKSTDDTWKSFKRKFPGQLSLEQRLSSLPDDRGLRQYKELRQRLANFLDVLSRKMNVDEMTYKRYKRIAEEVYMSGIKNLEKVADTVRLIDLEDIDSMKQQADNSGDKVKNTISKRLDMYEKEMDSIKRIYIENEEAITQMDEAIFSLNSIETSMEEEAPDMKDSMAELEEWTKRVKLYERA
jgi:DnaJ like chaperone protein